VIIVLEGCDVDCCLIVAICKHSRSTNDIIAWLHMDLSEAVEIDNQLPMKYFFIGDEALTNANQFLSPWPGKYIFHLFCLSTCCVILTVSAS
jgi:hypothetical protein